MNRYYFSRRKDGIYYIMDRTLKLHIAKCDFREAAHQVVKALNYEVQSQTARMEVPSKIKSILSCEGVG